MKELYSQACWAHTSVHELAHELCQDLSLILSSGLGRRVVVKPVDCLAVTQESLEVRDIDGALASALGIVSIQQSLELALLVFS